MAHDLDTTEGQTSFVSAREDAWHRLGTVLPETFSAEDAMEKGLLGGWNVRKAPLVASVPILGEVDPEAAADAEMLGLDAPVKTTHVSDAEKTEDLGHLTSSDRMLERLKKIRQGASQIIEGEIVDATPTT